MKRIALFIFGIFICTIVHAENINIDWKVDGNIYDTTICTPGDSITPPHAPSKYGYHFEKWQEVFYRGTFKNFYAIPEDSSLYVSDINGNTVPQNNDYLIIDDASDYATSYAEITYKNITNYKKGGVTFTHFDNYTGETTTRTVSFGLQGWYSPTRTVNDPVEFNGRILFYVTAGSNEIYIVPTETLIVNGSVSATDKSTMIINGYANVGAIGKILFGNQFLSGRWRFSYDGTWADNGKLGWKADYQITQK